MHDMKALQTGERHLHKERSFPLSIRLHRIIMRKFESFQGAECSESFHLIGANFIHQIH